MIKRDREREAQLLRQTGDYLGDGAASFIAGVLDRLDDQERRGCEGWQQPLSHLAAEAAEEGVDAPGWLIGLSYRLEEIDPSVAAELRIRLDRAVTHAALLWQECDQITRRLEELEQ